MLRNVTIVDTRDGAPTPRTDVRISGGVIAAITTAEPEAAQAAGAASETDAEVVDGSGRYLIPGYLDMHAHPLTEKHPVGDLELMLANGVTPATPPPDGTVRICGDRATPPQEPTDAQPSEPAHRAARRSAANFISLKGQVCPTHATATSGPPTLGR